MLSNMGFGVVVLLGLSGAFGAAVRFALSEWATKRWQMNFPLPTLLINVTGAFALGMLTTLGGASDALAQTRLLLGTGFLGGYTTFSTLSFDTHSLFRSRQTRAAWLNVLGSLGIGVTAAALGMLCGSLV
jgi:fluoride exporter